MKKKNNSSDMESILGEDTLTNHWEEAFAARTQSPIYSTQDQLVSLSITTDGCLQALSCLHNVWREWPRDSADVW